MSVHMLDSDGRLAAKLAYASACDVLEWAARDEASFRGVQKHPIKEMKERLGRYGYKVVIDSDVYKTQLAFALRRQ